MWPRGLSLEAGLGCTPPAGDLAGARACCVPVSAGVCHTVTSCTTASSVSRAHATRPALTAWPGDLGDPGDAAARHRLPPWPERCCVGYQAHMHIPPLPFPSLVPVSAGRDAVGLPAALSLLTRPRPPGSPHSAAPLSVWSAARFACARRLATPSPGQLTFTEDPHEPGATAGALLKESLTVLSSREEGACQGPGPHGEAAGACLSAPGAPSAAAHVKVKCIHL